MTSTSERHYKWGDYHYYLWKNDEIWIFNLATQDTKYETKLEYVEQVFKRLASNWKKEGIISIAMPRIASGLGGLDWHDVRQVIKNQIGHISIPVTIYKESI